MGLTPKKKEHGHAAIKTPLVKRKAFWGYILGVFGLAAVLFFTIFVRNDSSSGAAPDPASYPNYKDSILGTWAGTFFEPTGSSRRVGSSRRDEIITYLNGGHLSGTVKMLSEIDNPGTFERIKIAYDISYVGSWSIHQDEIIQTFDKVEVTPANELASKMKSENAQDWKYLVAEWMRLEVNTKTYYIYDINKNQMSLRNTAGSSTLEYKKKI